MKIDETIRKDGLRIVSCYLPRKRSVFVELVSLVGFAYDPPDKSGLFHVLEHMMLQGTKKRTAKELTLFAEKNFFKYNAGVSHTHTSFHANIIDRNLSLACDYLCDIYFNSILPTTSLKKERKIILLEATREQDSDNIIAERAMDKCLYEESPLLRIGVGTASGIDKISRSDLLKQKNEWFVPSNTIAIAMGNINHTKFVREISKRIPINMKKVALKEWPDEAIKLPLKKEVVIKRPNRENSILLLKCKIPRDIGLQEQLLLVISKNLINYSLMRETREKKGLTYVIQSQYATLLELGGEFYVYAETHPSKSAQVEKLIRKALARPLSDKNKIKNLLKKMLEHLEVSAVEESGYCYYSDLLMENILEGKPVQEVENKEKKMLKIISQLTLGDVEVVRKKYIRPERFAKVLLEPEDNKVEK